MIRIFVVDDHPATCEGLAEWLPMKDEDILCVGTAYEGWEALERIAALLPDVVLIDCKMPGLSGIAVTEEIGLQEWPVKVLALSAYSDSQTVNAMLQAGARGYILKMERRKTILEAIRAIERGERWYSQPILEQFVQPPSESKELTAQEQKVLHLLAEGYTSKQMAILLNIGPRTVETHVGKIYKKLGAKNMGDAVRIASENGLLRKGL